MSKCVEWVWHAFHHELASLIVSRDVTGSAVSDRRREIRFTKPREEVGLRLRYLRAVRRVPPELALCGRGLHFSELPRSLQRKLTALHKEQCPNCKWDRTGSIRAMGFRVEKK